MAATNNLATALEGYAGAGRTQRLLFIAEHSPQHRDAALRLAVRELQASQNTQGYAEVFDKRFTQACAEAGLTKDASWVESVEKKAQQTLDRLEHDLNSSKTSLVKEQIRRGHNDIGDFHAQRGDYAAALKCYVRARDYCTTSAHVVAMCLHVVRVSVLAGNYTHVLNYVTKAEQTSDVEDIASMSKLRACSGLANLEAAKYRQAARKFVETGAELDMPEVLLPQDVAVYGGLCALAAFDRGELREKVVNSHAFRTQLDHAPWLREAINAFFGSQYASCLGLMDKAKADLMLDLHLRAHVDPLYAMVRSKALVNYFSPYRSVDMGRMAAAFACDVAALERELVRLITDGTIQARIDSHNKVLYAETADQRHGTFKKAVKMGEDYAAECRALLLRINMFRSDFVVKRPDEHAVALGLAAAGAGASAGNMRVAAGSN